MDKIRVFLHNFLRLHQRVMMRFLQKRGWVVFFLESEHRDCKGMCWLKLYEAEQKKI